MRDRNPNPKESEANEAIGPCNQAAEASAITECGVRSHVSCPALAARDRGETDDKEDQRRVTS